MVNKWKYTTFSLAILLIGSFVLFGLSFKEKSNQSLSQNKETKIQTVLQPRGVESFTLSLDNIGEYTKTGQTVNHKCFEEADNTSDTDLNSLQKVVSKDNRTIYRACVFGDKAIVASIKKTREMWNEPYGMQIHIFTRTDDGY